MEFSFSASGWLFIYQLGVARTLQKARVNLPPICARCTGSSGGALVATCLVLDTDIDQVKRYFLNCVEDCKKSPRMNAFKMREYVLGSIPLVKQMVQKANPSVFNGTNFFDHEGILGGRLGISVTTLPKVENYIITKFDSQSELEQALLGSCTMTPLAGFPFRINRPGDPELDGKWVFDGGISNIQPSVTHMRKRKSHLDEDAIETVIRVAPFYHWDCDIKPSKYVPLWWTLHPPSVEEMEELYFLGMKDAETFLKKNSDKFKESAMRIRSSSNDLTKLVNNSSMPKVPTDADIDSAIKLAEIPAAMQASHEDHVFSEDVIADKAIDKAIVFSQKNFVKALAIGTIYAELSYLACYNLVKALIVAVEQKRRDMLTPSNHMLSLRRWVPDALIGTSGGSLSASMESAKAILNFSGVIQGIEEAFEANRVRIGTNSKSPETRSPASSTDASETEISSDHIDIDDIVDKESIGLVRNSFVYRSFLRHLF